MPGNIIMCPQDAPIAGAATPAKLCTAYWDIRGLAQPIRLVLEYVGADFDDIRIDAGPGAPGEPAYKGHWFDAKPDIGVNFANLPYMIDGELRLVQSNAILRHLGRKFNLMGASAEEHAMLDVLLDQGADFDNEFTGLCYRGWTEEKKTVYLAKLPTTLGMWASALGAKLFLVCGTPTVVDFKVAETLDKIKVAFGPDALASAPVIEAYTARVMSLPSIAAYRASDRCIERPLNNPHAGFK